MDVREFIFFDTSDSILFTRTDAESANWQVDELTLTCLFPYVPEKTIRRGMRIAFEDDDGVLQPFEIRKVRNYEPDRYQEITCEHIVISELTDAHTGEHEFTGVAPASALSTLLAEQPSGLTNEKRWAVGNVTATDTSSGDISIGSVWQNVRTIETNWNVYILPRVTWNESGITGRYLDIIPAAGVWHGLRLSIDKNTDEVGVTVDDTEVKTALFGYGGNSYTMKTDNLDKDKEAVTLVGYTWPGKPSGAAINSTLGYIEDTAATAMYGRNGVPRFGFYQNGDIDDPAVLAQKTWEALQTTNKPTVTVDCIVKDLYRLGYHDEKIRLHDTVMIDLLPMNDVLQLEIIKLSVDLLDPTGTRPTIGEYVPNIIYIQRQTMERASGGAGGGISGRRGGETESEAKWSEFQAEFVVNNTIMSYHAVQVDHDNKVLKAAGMDIDASGVITYAEDNVNMIGSKFTQTANRITQEITDRSNADSGLSSRITQEAGRITTEITDRTNADATLQSSIQQEANRISQIVTAVGSNGEVTAASIITAIDKDTSSVTISANKIDLNGLVTATEFQTALASIDNLVGDLNVVGAVTVGGNLSAGSLSAESYSDYKVDGTSIGLGNAYKTISLSGPNANNEYTLTATTFDGDSVTIGNFNRGGSSVASLSPIVVTEQTSTVNTTPIYTTGQTGTAIPIDVDATAVYNAGVTYGQGGNPINVEKGSWQFSLFPTGMSCTFSPSAGTGTSASVLIKTSPTIRGLSTSSTTASFNILDGSQDLFIQNAYLMHENDYAYIVSTNSSPSNSNVMARLYVGGGGTPGENRSVSSLGSIILGENDIGTTTQQTLVTYSDNTTDTKPIQIDASAVYLAGQASGSGLVIEQNKDYGTVTSNQTSYTISPTSGFGVMRSATFYVDVPPVNRTATGLQDIIRLPATHTGTAVVQNNTVIYNSGDPTNNFPVLIDASLVYQAGVNYGSQASGYQLTDVRVEGTPNYFRQVAVPVSTSTVKGIPNSTTALYKVDSSGSIYLRGTAVSQTFFGTLYSLGPGNTPHSEGTGSWFLVSNTNLDSLYRSSSLKLSLVTSTYTVTESTRTGYLPDSSGNITWYTPGRTVSDTYYVRT